MVFLGNSVCAISWNYFTKKYSITIFAYLVALSLNSCFDKIKDKLEEGKPEKPEYKTVEINDFSISIPEYMKETDQLHDDAVLQYMNIYKETYIVILEESKEEFIRVYKDLEEYNDSILIIRNYALVQKNFLKENIKVKEQTELQSLKINGMDAEMTELQGMVEGMPVEAAYLMALIEGRDNIYFIMTWTLKDKFEKYKSTFEEMIKSFKISSKPEENV